MSLSFNVKLQYFQSMDKATIAILAQVFLAIGLAAMILIVSHLLGQRGRPGKIKDTPYECGIQSSVEPIGPFSVKFYRVALMFILFDVALVLLVPWALSFKETAEQTLIPGIILIGFLTLALFYVIRRGTLKWES